RRGGEQIAYRQGDLRPVDIHFVLTVMGLLKLDKYPDRKTHPYGLFGQPRKVLTEFGDDVKREKSAFRKFLPRLQRDINHYRQNPTGWRERVRPPKSLKICQRTQSSRFTANHTRRLLRGRQNRGPFPNGLALSNRGRFSCEYRSRRLESRRTQVVNGS